MCNLKLFFFELILQVGRQFLQLQFLREDKNLIKKFHNVGSNVIRNVFLIQFFHQQLKYLNYLSDRITL